MIHDGDFDDDFQEEQAAQYWLDEMACLACAMIEVESFKSANRTGRRLPV